MQRTLNVIAVYGSRERNLHELPGCRFSSAWVVLTVSFEIQIKNVTETIQPSSNLHPTPSFRIIPTQGSSHHHHDLCIA
jgi:hypothetical protein